MKLRRFLMFAGAAYGLVAGTAWAAPSGKIGYIGASGAQVWHLTSGKTQTLPHSKGADLLAVSPSGTALFFVPNGQKSTSPDAYALENGWISRAPYSWARLVLDFQGVGPQNFLWNRGGDALYVTGYQLNGFYSPARDQWHSVGFFPASFDARGGKIGYSSDENVIVRDAKSGRERIVFSMRKPQAIFDALRRAKNLKNVADLRAGEKNPDQWQFGGPALSPDGTRAYFSSNCGTGYGAAGNGMQGFFACDLRTGKISVLSGVEPIMGRPPQLTISPDGKRLLAVSSVHSSAADNSSVAFVIDLETQKSRELLGRMPGSRDKANFFGGSAWSPDGKYVALSTYFYDLSQAMRGNGEWSEPKNSQWRTAIFESASGKLWRLKAGMRAPQWIR